MGKDQQPPQLEENIKVRLFGKLLSEIFHSTPTNRYSLQLYRSVIVSVIALIVNLAAYYVLKQLAGVHYLLSALIGYSLGIILNYYLSVKWVFATRRLAKKHHEFIVFVLINLTGLGLYELLIWLMVDRFGLSTLVAPLLGNVLVFFWNFLSRKKILY